MWGTLKSPCGSTLTMELGQRLSTLVEWPKCPHRPDLAGTRYSRHSGEGLGSHSDSCALDDIPARAVPVFNQRPVRVGPGRSPFPYRPDIVGGDSRHSRKVVVIRPRIWARDNTPDG